jgi:hypothetical protein
MPCGTGGVLLFCLEGIQVAAGLIQRVDLQVSYQRVEVHFLYQRVKQRVSGFPQCNISCSHPWAMACASTGGQLPTAVAQSQGNG